MRIRSVLIATSSIATCVLLASTTGSATQTRAPTQQRAVEVALDANGDHRADDRDGDGIPDRYLDAAFTCATSCGLKLTAAEQCAILGPVVYFCVGYAVYRCVKDCASTIEHVDDN
jgi:hypothetical protein